MNNLRIKIIAYIDGSMNPEEKLLFEKELDSSPRIKEEMREVQHFMEIMRKDAEPSVNESYFINILPGFYRRQSAKKKFPFSRIVYSLTAAAVILFLFMIFNPKTPEYSDLKELSAVLSEQEINETLNQYENPYSFNDLMYSSTSKTDSIVNNMVKAELNLSTGSVDRLVSEQYINTDDLLDSINENEASELYAQLINEDIINGVR